MGTMIGAARRACQRRIAPAATVLAAAFLLAPAAARPAWAVGDWIGVEAAGFRNTPDGTAAVRGDGLDGTEFDLRDTLGMDTPDTSPMARLWFRWGKKNRLFFDYLATSHDGDATLGQTLVFDGVTFDPGERVASTLKLNLAQGRYRYSFVNIKVFEFGLGIGLNQARVRADLEGSSAGAVSVDEDLPFATLAAGAVIKPLLSFHIRIEADGLAVGRSGDSLKFNDWRGQVEWYFVHFFGFFAGYRSVHLEADSDEHGRATIDYTGPYAGLGVKF
jgi:hypothetical protein